MTGKQPTEDWLSEEERELFGRVEVQHTRSKDDVWAALQAKTQAAPPPQRSAKVISIGSTQIGRLPLSIAASVALVICLTLTARLYTRTVTVTSGELATVTLPDGSAVQLNTQTTVSYQPYWWWARRQVNLEGEAFFEVAKGSTFTVVSPQGSTQVLGTSFNIRAREATYHVLCKTGRVRVSSGKGEEVILTPGQYTERTADGLRPATELEGDRGGLGWLMNRFVYNTTPMTKVIADLERHYEITIATEDVPVDTLYFTGMLPRELAAEEALEIICYSYRWRFEATQEAKYRLTLP